MAAKLQNLLVGLVLLAGQAAYADMWIYTDPKGVKHFASSQLDKRYQLMFRGLPASSADTAEVVGSGQMEARTTEFSAKSVAAIEVSPGFMAVKDHLRTAADAHQLDMALLQAVIHTESRFNPTAVSPKGAVGLMQVMPATAERYGLANDQRGTVSAKLTDPKTNIQTGARYLRDLIKMFPGQLELAVAAYNAGEGAVQRAGNKIPNYKETQNYVRSVMQLYQRLNPQARGVVPAASTGARVQGQFHSANVNLRWDGVSSPQEGDAQAKKTWRDPLHAHDLVIGSGQTAKAAQSLTELSN
ncbi:lytic transglycosylase domain-containing protein [Rhodoferax sp. AJA081-3]|uniref:lytic transglycosylase domain-containing protein n=1 Tax=Rhodoferax sp. AJA081-3 TaxID=2752316 RepID=UPI001AE00908|nr:lytic transglycosylase domain-containing protein [Rhodoferax sp. AJA081-3]QTN29563.1 lytic transglycosylase domain-containing protein [Rhodoferax sp. AJA081-3]